MATIIIKYKGEIIAEISPSSPTRKILETSGKYTEGDIEIVYVNYCPRAEEVTSYNFTDFLNSYIFSASAVEVVE